jgi:capsular polysaccharide transport system permease protein
MSDNTTALDRQPLKGNELLEQRETSVPAAEFRRRPSAIDQFESSHLQTLAFVFMVVMPVLFAGVYYGFVASDQYAAEMRFSVRRAEPPIVGEDVLALLAKGMSVNSVGREPYMVANYLRSRNVVEELDRDGWLRWLYTTRNADLLSRLDPKASSDELMDYWRSKITVAVDRISGLVTVRVFAFTPDDALAVATAVQTSAERMIDRAGLKAREDTLRAAEEDLARARRRFADALVALRQVREGERTVDPKKTLEMTGAALIETLRQKLALERERDINLRVLSPAAPQLRILNQRIKALDIEIFALNQSLAGPTTTRTAADAISSFEERELESRISEKLLTVSQASYERARLNAARQHIYLTTFVEAVRPDKAEYPDRVRGVALVAVCAGFFWGILLMLAAAVNDHRLSY